MRELNIGLVGYGFMGRTHSNAFLQAPRFFDLPRRPVLKAVAARNEERVKKFAANWGYESYTTDWRELVGRKDIDVIDIASPNDTHHDIAIAAAKAGKMVMCEKPQGGEGLWRLDVAVAGSGVTGDLLAHNIDTALWLNGPITEVTAMTETFIKERKHSLTGQVQAVGIDDASAFLCRFENGSLAMFEATRYARGHKALYTLEINGEHASAFWDLHDLHRIQYFDHKDEGRVRGWRNIHVTDGDQPYMKHWWVPGLQIGYEHTFTHQFADFVEASAKGASLPPTFRDGLATDYVTDAVLKSAKTKQWEKVNR